MTEEQTKWYNEEVSLRATRYEIWCRIEEILRLKRFEYDLTRKNLKQEILHDLVTAIYKDTPPPE